MKDKNIGVITYSIVCEARPSVILASIYRDQIFKHLGRVITSRIRTIRR